MKVTGGEVSGCAGGGRWWPDWATKERRCHLEASAMLCALGKTTGKKKRGEDERERKGYLNKMRVFN